MTGPFDPHAAVILRLDDTIEITSDLRLAYSELDKEYRIPGWLWARGDLSCLDRPTVGIVGSRNATPYGLATAKRLAGQLAQAGYTVVSGFARGIDTEAHRACVSFRQPTVAVFPCGPDVYTPQSNSDLAQQMLEAGGLILSEYRPGTKPETWAYPARNRIIAAVSDAVVVVEAQHRSGSLITAKFAEAYKKPMLAVPGEIGARMSEGTNELIRSRKARILLDLDDVREAVAIGQERREAA